MRKLSYLLLVLFLTTALSAFAQKKKSDVSISIHDDDADININIDDLGEVLQAAFSSLDGDFSFHIDNDDINIKVNNVNVDWDDLERDIEKAVESAVKNMTLELRNIDVDELEEGDSRFNGTDLRDIIDEIEDEYNKEVEVIDRMVLKFDKDYTLITMDVTLENGKEVRNIKRKIRD